jgi:hypothetical protein
LKDIVNKGNLDWVSLQCNLNYKIENESISKEIGPGQQMKTYKISLMRDLELPVPEAPKLDDDDYFTSLTGEISDTISKASTQESPRMPKEKKQVKGFKPKYIDGVICLDSCDLKVSELFYEQRVKSILMKKKKMSYTEMSIVKDYFRHYTITDEQRKELWRVKIGNKLNITEDLFKGLLTRLQTGDYCKATERQIQADLDRTFPDCDSFKEGREMYSKLQLILLLFHIYRPDIAYIQGMNDVVAILFYYFDVYETFKFFTNLIVTNDVLHTMYTFNLQKVSQNFLTKVRGLPQNFRLSAEHKLARGDANDL